MTTHTFGIKIDGAPDQCQLCPGPHGGAGPCDHYLQYPRSLVRFVAAHLEAYQAAYLDGNAQAARPELDRLEAEYRTRPPRHDCSCYPTHCRQCLKLASQRPTGPSTIEIGRTAPVHPPAPLTLLLDIAAGYAA